jgi:EAL domain-containing protein (putative c-di-GMP-specific phosphodiesterase class I)
MAGETPGAVLRRLREVGVVLLLDDFGTGYSSLSRLRRFPLDVVKVDRSFVSGLSSLGQDHALVVGVLSLAHALGKTVVAEGIETEQQMAALCAAGCDAGQGFLLARPVPAEQLPAALRAAALAAAGAGAGAGR